MRILQVGKFYPIRGGVEKVMYDLMLGLSERGIQCDMLCASTEDYPAGDIKINDRATLMVMPTKIKFAATMLSPKMILRLRKIARTYDIVHLHHPDPMAALSLYLSGYRGKVVLHWHADIVKQKNLLKLYKPLQNWIIKRATMIVGTSPVYVRESSFLQNVQNKTDYIPIGVNPIVADPIKAQAIRDKYLNKKIVFSLGRLVEYKGYEYLVKAAQFLDDSYHIVIGGKGPLKEQLMALVQDLGVGDRVEFINFISDEDLPDYYEASDLFCLSSIIKTEAFAIVQVEAMSCGKPIVSTKIPGSGVSWVNAHGISGHTVNIEDEKGIAAAIMIILGDEPYRQQLSRGAKNRYQELFTRDAMVDKSLQLYKSILNGR